MKVKRGKERKTTALLGSWNLGICGKIISTCSRGLQGNNTLRENQEVEQDFRKLGRKLRTRRISIAGKERFKRAHWSIGKKSIVRWW